MSCFIRSEFAVNKLKKSGFKGGTFLLRQSPKKYDNFFLTVCVQVKVHGPDDKKKDILSVAIIKVYLYADDALVFLNIVSEQKRTCERSICTLKCVLKSFQHHPHFCPHNLFIVQGVWNLFYEVYSRILQ